MLTDLDLDNLQWAKEFMDRYEKKHPKSTNGRLT